MNDRLILRCNARRPIHGAGAGKAGTGGRLPGLKN